MSHIIISHSHDGSFWMREEPDQRAVLIPRLNEQGVRRSIKERLWDLSDLLLSEGIPLPKLRVDDPLPCSNMLLGLIDAARIDLTARNGENRIILQQMVERNGTTKPDHFRVRIAPLRTRALAGAESEDKSTITVTIAFPEADRPFATNLRTKYVKAGKRLPSETRAGVHVAMHRLEREPDAQLMTPRMRVYLDEAVHEAGIGDGKTPRQRRGPPTTYLQLVGKTLINARVCSAEADQECKPHIEALVHCLEAQSLCLDSRIHVRHQPGKQDRRTRINKLDLPAFWQQALIKFQPAEAIQADQLSLELRRLCPAKWAELSDDQDSLRRLVAGAGLMPQYAVIRLWLNGNIPRLSSEPFLRRFVEYLGGDPEHAVQLATAARPKSLVPSVITSVRERTLIRRILPEGFQHLPDQQQAEIALSLRADIYHSSSFKKAAPNSDVLQKLPKTLPGWLASEWDELVKYKYTLEPFDVPRVGKWTSEDTLLSHLQIFKHYGSFCLHHVDFGGLGLRDKDCSITFLVAHKTLVEFAEFVVARNRRGQTSSTMKWFKIVANLLTLDQRSSGFGASGVRGLLHHRPGWANRLVPVPGVISEDEIAKLACPANWSEALTLRHRDLKSIRKFHSHKTLVVRDSPGRAAAAIISDSPLSFIDDMIDKHYSYANGLLDEYRRAFAIRAVAILIIFRWTALRRHEVSQMTYLPDNTGHMRRDELSWFIFMPKACFKNNGAACWKHKDGYHFRFPEYCNNVFDEFFTHSREIIDPGHADNRAALVTRTHKAMDKGAIARVVFDISYQHMAYHASINTGVPGMDVVTSHVFRYLAVADMLKKTDNMFLAAAVIRDSVATTGGIYARIQAMDLAASVRSHMLEGFVPPPWGSEPYKPRPPYKPVRG